MGRRRQAGAAGRAESPAPRARGASSSAFRAPPGPLLPIARPRTETFAVGDYVVVPRAVYPTYPCREYDGGGWEGLIMSRRGTVAVVKFTRATTANGRAYLDVPLDVSALQACPQ